TSITTGANYTINVNNSDYLRGYSPTTLRSWMESYFNGVYVQLTELTNLVGNWSADKPNYYTKTEINNSYVPYLGANQNINLGNNNLTINGTTLYIDTNNSRVGIGTTSPTTPLQVLGKINSITSVSRGTSVEFVGQDPNDLAAYPRAYFYGHSGSAITNFGLYTASGDAISTTQTPVFMGVSTNSNVKQASSVQGLIYLDTTKMVIYNLGAESSARAVPIYFGASSNPDMIITTTSRVGIGTTNPKYKLEVNGNFSANNTQINGNATILGDLTINNQLGITINKSMLNSSSITCWMNYTSGILTWSDC
ncbi:MAG: hypothetical protein M0R17_09530, partial [Candidatus Omnitrophica bacterium]|nr:hypothetical protein [Candidatus Omnitrophota bacterium]